MSAFDDKKFEAVLAVVKRAVTDNEKFAALLIISKSISPSTIPEQKLHSLLDSIGLQFPCRLLSTACKQSEDQETREAYAAIAASVVKLFCLYHKHGTVDVIAIIPLLLRGIETFPSCKDMVDDCLEALSSLLERQLDIDYIAVFKVIVSAVCPLEGKALSTLRVVLQNYSGITVAEPFKDWLNDISAKFNAEKDNAKFEICKILCDVFQKVHKPPKSNEWLNDVMIGVENILCSKVTKEHQHNALELASELLSWYGMRSFIDKSCDKNFIIIVTRLSCIEAGLLFQDVLSHDSKFCTNQENSMSFILSCFKIIEIFCAAIAEFEQNETDVVEDVLNFDQIRLAQPTLSEMAGFIKEYISQTLAYDGELYQNEMQLFHSCIRVFGSWMNIEYNLSSSQGAEALLVMPSLLRYVRSIKNLRLIKFILPAVILSTDSHGLNTSIVNEIFSVLCNTLNDFIKTESTHECQSEENMTTNLIIQCIIAICQSQFKEISHNNEVVSDVIESIKQGIAKYNGNLMVQAYIYTLVIIWLNLFPTIQSGSDQLFLKCLDFLFEAFELPAADELVLAAKYQNCWVEVFPLWQVISCEVVKYCRKNFAGRHIYQNSHWHNLLSDISNATKISNDFGNLAGLLELGT